MLPMDIAKQPQYESLRLALAYELTLFGGAWH